MKITEINKSLLSSLFIVAAFAMTSCSDSPDAETESSEPKEQATDDHGHGHAPHMGVMIPFAEGQMMTPGQAHVGFAEIKLHDDKGDLELWLSKDGAGEQAMDLPLNTAVTVIFPSMNYKIVNLKIRNADKNEDEDGNGNIRNGNTNYFIFPGDSGDDASFLVGKDFAAEAIISFSVNGKVFSTKSFKLSPHTH